MRKALPFWGNLHEKERRLLIEHAVTTAYPKGKVVFHYFEMESGIRIVQEGLFRISIHTEQGGELFINQLGPGELCPVNIVSIVRKFQWNIGLEALQKSETVTVPNYIYLEACKNSPEMESFSRQIQCAWLAEALHITSEYALASTEQRLAGLLLRYREIDDNDCLRTTHERMARDIGTAREVVTRMLKQFADDGAVEVHRGMVTILDINKLKKLHLK